MTAIRNAVFFLRSYSKSIEDSKALHHLDVIDNELTQSDEVIQRLLELTKGEKIKLINSDLRKIAHDAFLYLILLQTFNSKSTFKKLPRCKS